MTTGHAGEDEAPPRDARESLLAEAEQAAAAGLSRTAEQLRRDAEVVQGDEGRDEAGEGGGAGDLDRAAHAERRTDARPAVDLTIGQRPPG